MDDKIYEKYWSEEEDEEEEEEEETKTRSISDNEVIEWFVYSVQNCVG